MKKDFLRIPNEFIRETEEYKKILIAYISLTYDANGYGISRNSINIMCEEWGYTQNGGKRSFSDGMKETLEMMIDKEIVKIKEDEMWNRKDENKEGDKNKDRSKDKDNENNDENNKIKPDKVYRWKIKERILPWNIKRDYTDIEKDKLGIIVKKCFEENENCVNMVNYYGKIMSESRIEEDDEIEDEDDEIEKNKNERGIKRRRVWKSKNIGRRDKEKIKLLEDWEIIKRDGKDGRCGRDGRDGRKWIVG